jgi:hypothetical protein
MFLSMRNGRLNNRLEKNMVYTVEVTDKKTTWRNQDGELHREDGPALIDAYGSKFWYRNDELHREDGPAIIYADGSKRWYRNGRCHREDGPAVIYAYGYKVWFRNGQCHREDGPAIIRANGSKEWYLNGERLTVVEFNARQARENQDCDGRVVEIDGVAYQLKKVQESS